MGLANTARQRLSVGLLTALTLISTTDSWAKRKPPTPLQEPVPCNEAFQDVGDNLKKSDAVATETAVVKLARSVIDTTEDPDLLRTAKKACWEVTSVDGGYSLAAFSCIGQAATGLAQLDEKPRVNHTDAYCAYQVVAELAQRAQPVDDGTLADAQQGRGDALMGLRRSAGERSQEYTTLAIQAYEEAIRLQPTASRHFALGRNYITLGRGKKAEREITAGAALEPSGAETALALVALGEFKRKEEAPAEDVLAVLQLAKKAAPDSIAANGAIGVAYYENGKMDAARKAFAEVMDAPGDATAGTRSSTNYRAEAHFYVGMLDAEGARNKADWQEVVDNAERAVQAGGGDFRYRRLVCLAHIARGGDSIRDGDSGAWCEGQDTAEGQLLRGMYYLRRGQHVPRFTLRSPPSKNELKWRDYLRQAEDAFDSGTKAGAEGAVDWPGLGQSTDLASTLVFGEEVVRHSNMFCRTSLQDDGKSREKALFERYGVLGCKP